MTVPYSKLRPRSATGLKRAPAFLVLYTRLNNPNATDVVKILRGDRYLRRKMRLMWSSLPGYSLKRNVRSFSERQDEKSFSNETWKFWIPRSKNLLTENGISIGLRNYIWNVFRISNTGTGQRIYLLREYNYTRR